MTTWQLCELHRREADAAGCDPVVVATWLAFRFFSDEAVGRRVERKGVLDALEALGPPCCHASRETFRDALRRAAPLP